MWCLRRSRRWTSGLSMDQGDFEDIRASPALRAHHRGLAEYNVIYVGQQQEDELHCYVFDIAPKKIEGKKRYFQGRIWVDDHDFQIVKTYGKTVPDIRKKRQRQRRESVSQIHHLAAADRRPILVSRLHQSGRRTALQAAGHPHPRDREVRGLQALRIEREDSVSRQGNAEG